MAFKMFSTGLLLAFAGMCVCNPAGSPPSQYQSSAVSQASFQTGSAAVQPPQTKLEDIERDSLAAAYGQKTQPQSAKPSSVNSPVIAQQPQQPAYQAVSPQQQYFVQPYQTQQQFYVQPFQAQQQYLAQPYQSLFDYSALQYFGSPNAYNPGNQFYQQYYVPSAQPSAIPQYVTKQSSPAVQTTAAQQNSAPVQVPQEYKQQFAVPAQAQQEYKQQFAAPAQAQQEYKQQFAAPAQAQQAYKQQFAAPAQAQQAYKQQQSAAPAQAPQEYKQQFASPAQAPQEYKQQQFSAPASAQQYVFPAPAYQYVQQPAAAVPVDFSYVTRHPSGNAVASFKVPAVGSAAVQPQLQYSEVPPQYYQPQNYYTVPSAAAAAAATPEQPRVQQSAKSQFSSGIKSTTPFPLKDSFAYKFESSPSQQQQSGATYSTIKYTA